jgi:hypothetical protein
MNKALTIFIIAIAVIVAGYFFIGNKINLPKSTSKVEQNEVSKVTPSQLVSENATTTYVVMNLSYPKSSATDKPEIYNYIKETKKEFFDPYNHLTKAEADKMYIRSDEPYELYVNTKIATTDKTVSYILETYNYTGGAHGGTEVNTFTYDKSGKLVKIDDVLTSGWLKEIATMSRSYFYNTLGDYSQPSMIDDGTEPNVENFSSWYLTGDNIVFVFGQYQVGPYVLGIQEYKINKSQIPELLQPAYK